MPDLIKHIDVVPVKTGNHIKEDWILAFETVS